MPAKRKTDSISAKRIASRTEDKLTPEMKATRDAFVAEYLVDWSCSKAWVRIGGGYTSRYRMGAELLREPYVARRIKELVDILAENQITNNKRILAGLVREANYHGRDASHSARVSAFGLLAKINGMEAPTRVEHSGGVMVVPGVHSVDDWERSAIEAQAKLKADVRD